MLPKILEKNSTIFKIGKEWDNYLSKIGKLANTIDHDFLSQICYEHYHRFNDYFPKFNIEKQKIIRIQMTTKEI